MGGGFAAVLGSRLGFVDSENTTELLKVLRFFHMVR